MNPWEILLRRIMRAHRWPIPSELPVRQSLAVWTALRESDENTIRALMQWPKDRPLIIDNLPEKVASAFGDLLFGADPRWMPTNTQDLQRLSDMTDPWAAELPAAEETCVSEGEVWWRLSTNPELAHPVLSWHSRTDVVPLLHGRTVLAAAFVSRLPNYGEEASQVTRHIEVHGRGFVLNLLFRGREEMLGQELALTEHPETELLTPTWSTGVDALLCGRIVNRWGRRPLVGRSVYAGTWTRMLALNEAVTIGRENVRLTAKKRSVVSASAVRANQAMRPDGSIASVDRGDGVMVPVMAPSVQFDAGEDVLIHDPLDADEGANAQPPFKVLEYSFEAEALIAWMRYEVETICQRCDLVPQFLGSGDFGTATSGTALRVRLLPTDLAADGRGRAWDGELPIITQRAQLLEAQPRALGGVSVQWSEPGGLPAVERGDPLPQDENEIATRHATLRTAELISIETSLRERYPDREDEWITAEVERIRADTASTLPAATFGGGTSNPPVPPPPRPPGD